MLNIISYKDEKRKLPVTVFLSPFISTRSGHRIVVEKPHVVVENVHAISQISHKLLERSLYRISSDRHLRKKKTFTRTANRSNDGRVEDRTLNRIAPVPRATVERARVKSAKLALARICTSEYEWRATI